MKTLLRNSLAVIIGALVGGMVNMSIVLLGPYIIAPPPGVDMTTSEGMQAAQGLLEAKHFLFPFLAHAIGTLVGAFLAALIAKKRQLTVAMVVGCFFLVGGISATFMFPAPTWFIITDLALAYIPLAWLGYRLRCTLR